MGKTTQRRSRKNTGTLTHSRISWKTCAAAVRAKLAKSSKACERQTVSTHRLRQLLTEQTLECSVCLQTLLWPVLGQCGHHVCLPCAEELAQNNYACGMCHKYEPSFQLRVDGRFQQLVRAFLEGCPPQEILKYQQRQKALQEKEASRRLPQLGPGDFVDFWNTEERVWTTVMVREVTKDGQVSIHNPKATTDMKFSIQSRRLARHRHHTKEETVMIEDVENSDSPVVNRAPPMFGMPMYLGFFGNQDYQGGFNFDINDLMGFGYRQFPF